ncbi:MAG: 4-(cytidine 5'-diphospho)-2-C-methyl-D-erythritol kinase [Pseudomonadota bacterium]
MSAPLKSPAKINLWLRVFERMPSGYHRIETGMLKLDLADDIDLRIGSGTGIRISVPGFPDLETDANLAVRAAKAYFEAAGTDRSVEIRITKRIPIGGGLGGGSSDAGTVLMALQKGLKGLDPVRLRSIGAALGADVPFFMESASFGHAKGIGEDVSFEKAPPSRPVLLVNPGFPVSTAEAYQALNRSLTWEGPDGSSFAPQSGPKNWHDLERLMAFGNDLQEVVERIYPEIRGIREGLREAGSVFAQMSGSGSTVFGLFDRGEQAEAAVSKLDPRWKVTVTETLE